MSRDVSLVLLVRFLFLILFLGQYVLLVRACIHHMTSVSF